MHTRYFQRGTSTIGFREENKSLEKGLYIDQTTKNWIKENFPDSFPLLHASIISSGIKEFMNEINTLTICSDEPFEIVKYCLLLLHPELEGKILRFEKTEDRKNSYADSTASKMAKQILKLNNIHRNKGFNLSRVNFEELHDKMKFLKKSGAGTNGFNRITYLER